MLNKIVKIFDKMEDKIRSRLSRRPILYAFVGCVGIVLIWRGVWVMADEVNMPGWVSLALGVGITVATGLFVSFFIGERIIISGIKGEKRIEEKTEEEIRKEDITLAETEVDLHEIKEELQEIKKELQ